MPYGAPQRHQAANDAALPTRRQVHQAQGIARVSIDRVILWEVVGTIRQIQPEDVRSVQLASVHPDLRHISVAVYHLKTSSRSQHFAKAPRTPALLDAVVAAALAILPLEGCVIGQDPITMPSFEAAPSRTSTAWAVHAASTFLINYHGRQSRGWCFSSPSGRYGCGGTR